MNKMKASELRIGNLVNGVLTQKPYIIDVWGLREMENGNYQSSQDTETKVFEPIPLTEEWLLKFGFIKNTYPNLHWFKCIDNGDKIAFTQHKEYGSNKHLSFYFNCGGLNNYSSIDLQLIYVHQLQNLYFALTGEELTIKKE